LITELETSALTAVGGYVCYSIYNVMRYSKRIEQCIDKGNLDINSINDKIKEVKSLLTSLSSFLILFKV
jgi:hypothetical protein